MLWGREPERDRLAALLARGGALLLRGDPGIGKSALLDEAAAIAGERGTGVLRADGARAESEMPVAARRCSFVSLAAK